MARNYNFNNTVFPEDKVMRVDCGFGFLIDVIIELDGVSNDLVTCNPVF